MTDVTNRKWNTERKEHKNHLPKCRRPHLRANKPFIYLTIQTFGIACPFLSSLTHWKSILQISVLGLTFPSLSPHSRFTSTLPDQPSSCHECQAWMCVVLEHFEETPVYPHASTLSRHLDFTRYEIKSIEFPQPYFWMSTKSIPNYIQPWEGRRSFLEENLSWSITKWIPPGVKMTKYEIRVSRFQN